MERLNRRITNCYLRHLLQGIEEEMGRQGLRMVLRQSGLERYVPELPPNNHETVSFASELAALQNGIRAYFGHGALGSLNRIGRATWRRMLAEAPVGQRLRLYYARLLPEPTRAMKLLQALLEEICEGGGKSSVHLLDPDLILVDKSSDFTFGQTDELNICWVTQGMLEEVLQWGSNQEYDVEEITCRATGGEVCKFQIRPL